jgi:hypothetical protein
MYFTILHRETYTRIYDILHLTSQRIYDILRYTIYYFSAESITENTQSLAQDSLKFLQYTQTYQYADHGTLLGQRDQQTASQSHQAKCHDVLEQCN